MAEPAPRQMPPRSDTANMRVPGRVTPQRVPTGYAEKASASGYRVNVAPKNADAEVEALGAQIVELLSRIRTVEESLAQAEQRADEAEDIALELEQQLNNATQLAESNARAAARPVLPRFDDVDVTPPKSSGGAWFAWLLCLLLLGGAAAAFVLVYQPMLQKLQAAEKQNQDQAGQHTQELSAMRASFAEERSRLESQLAAAQSTATAAAAAPAAATAAPAAEPAAQAAHEGKSHGSDAAEARAAKAEEKKAERAAKREERLAKKAEQKAERATKKSEAKKSSDDGGESKPKKASASGGSDDPLEGM